MNRRYVRDSRTQATRKLIYRAFKLKPCPQLGHTFMLGLCPCCDRDLLVINAQGVENLVATAIEQNLTTVTEVREFFRSRYEAERSNAQTSQ